MRWFLSCLALLIIIWIARLASLGLASQAQAETWECYVNKATHGADRPHQIISYKGKPITHLFVREGKYFPRPAGPIIYKITDEFSYKNPRTGKRGYTALIDSSPSNGPSDNVSLTNDKDGIRFERMFIMRSKPRNPLEYEGGPCVIR